MRTRTSGAPYSRRCWRLRRAEEAGQRAPALLVMALLGSCALAPSPPPPALPPQALHKLALQLFPATQISPVSSETHAQWIAQAPDRIKASR